MKKSPNTHLPPTEPQDIIWTPMGPRGLRYTPYVRADRKDQIYLRWPRKAVGGYDKIRSDLTWPEGEKL